jgi:hypothetical protein
MIYEYKTIVLPFKVRFFSQGIPDISTALNREAREGWRLCQACTPVGMGGSTVNMIAILERPAN